MRTAAASVVGGDSGGGTITVEKKREGKEGVMVVYSLRW